MDNAQNQFKRSLLYYPTIRIPSGQWLKQAILYWDEVGSIVPQEYGGNWLVEKSRDLEYLVGEGLFHPFDPRQVSYDGQVASEMTQEIKTIVKSPLFKKSLSSRKIRTYPSRIHLDKTWDEIIDFLIKKKLVRKESPDGTIEPEWLYFENSTALIYMSLLAKHLARKDNRNVITLPGTDRYEYQYLSFLKNPGMEEEIGIEVKIRNWLPIPNPDVPIQEIVTFKRQRQDELLPLQLLMLDFEQKLKNAESIDHAKEITNRFDLDKRIGINNLKKSLIDSGLETGWGSLNTLMGVTPAPLVGFLSSKIAELAHIGDPLAVGVIGFSLSAFVGLQAYQVSRQNVMNEKLRNSPYSYFLHAEQESIILG